MGFTIIVIVLGYAIYAALRKAAKLSPGEMCRSCHSPVARGDATCGDCGEKLAGNPVMRYGLLGIAGFLMAIFFVFLLGEITLL